MGQVSLFVALILIACGLKAERIVSLSPALTETVCALGKCDDLVGVDRYSNYPKQVNSLPKLGGGVDPNIELVVALKPDIILLATSAQGAERLASLGFKVVALEPKTHADVKLTLHAVAKHLKLPAVEAERVWLDINQRIDAAMMSLPVSAKGQRVYFEVNNAPYAASSSSFIGETLTRLGVGNIVPGHLGPFPKLNPEFVVREKPDLIMVSDRQYTSMAARPGWASISALKNNKLCVFTPNEGDSLVRAGPRMAEGAEVLAKCIKAHYQ